jgi:CheY-like chemotaxis protein
MEAIGHLAGGIAHDFNNMLTAIIGYGSLLGMHIDKDSELKFYVDQILSSAEKSANLTRQLLAFSRKQTIAPKETDLNELIKGMKKLLLRIIGEDIELQAHLEEKDITVMVDPGQIEQVLMNLCTNARDAMPNGGLLSISTEAVRLDKDYTRTHDLEKPGRYALIAVTDTGIGIDEKNSQKIFEPFFTTKELGKGTGLGLSIVYGIIKQHNGNITVYSEPGRGTTFRIYLPLITANTEEAERVETVMPKGGTETILVVEDNEEVRTLTKHVLEGFGYKVIEAEDGEDGINRFAAQRDEIQLVIIDVIMPKMSGKDAMDEIKKIQPDMKVLFTSGYTADIINKKGILEEGTNFISKPITPYELLARVRELLDKEAKG